MEQDVETLALNTVEAIIADLTDRGGIGDEWEQIDEETQDEIRFAWASLITKAIRTGQTQLYRN